MAEEKKTAAVEAPGQKYSIEQLGKNCRELFGVTRTVFIGATFGLQGQYTVDEMAKIIENWSGKEIG